MKTYIYETIPSGCCEEPRHFEIEQSECDAPLDVHPESGEPIRRVTVAGQELVKEAESSGSCGCSGGGCC